METYSITHPTRPDIRFFLIRDEDGQFVNLSMTDETLAAFKGVMQDAIDWLLRYLETGITCLTTPP